MNLEIIGEIVTELADPEYRDRIHGSHNAYSKGCDGPLCRKYNRDKVRENYRKRHPEVQRARAPRDPELDDMLTRVIAAHTRQVLHERAEVAERDILASVS